MVWYPYHMLLGIMKAITAAVMLVGAIMSYPLIGRALQLTSIKAYRESAESLARQHRQMTKLLEESSYTNSNMATELTMRTQAIFSAVRAIAKETARSCMDIPSYMAQFNSRLVSLSTCCDVLKANEWSGAKLADVVHSQIEVFPELRNQVQIEGPEIIVTPDVAQHISMAIHELAANTVQHGINGAKRPVRCTATWHVSEDALSTLRFNWNENVVANDKGERALVPNGISPLQPAHKGFGRVVLEYVVPTAVHGYSELQFCNDGGVSYELQAPLKNLVAA
jgi:two-component sensor histidine kinase